MNRIHSEKRFPYILVLTHDIDVLSIKELPLLGKTFWGFIYRSIIVNLFRLIRGGIGIKEYIKSIVNVLLVPFAKIGIVNDPWQESIRIMLRIEKEYDVRSTLFFITAHKKAGLTPNGEKAPSNRAAHYYLNNYRKLLSDLVQKGWEIGVHGIDAYRDLNSAKIELKELIRLVPEESKIGIRIHWLYSLGEKTWQILDEAGYVYDASFGWNDKIGFPGAKFSPFRPTEVRQLVILPLIIQDVALLDGKHKYITKEESWEKIKSVLQEAKRLNAVVTILWHNNSFVTPRFWGWLYERIIQQAKNDGAYICRAIDAVELFLAGEKWS